LDFYFLKRLTDDEGKLTSSPAKDPEKTSSIYTVDAFHVGNVSTFSTMYVSPRSSFSLTTVHTILGEPPHFITRRTTFTLSPRTTLAIPIVVSWPVL